MQTKHVKVITVKRMISFSPPGLFALDKQVREAYSCPSPNQLLEAILEVKL